MLRLTIASAFLVLLASGCGSDSGSGDEEPKGGSAETEAPTDAGATYFERADSDAINTTAATAQAALAKAYTQRVQKQCNAAVEKGYPAWRSCWHQALDPTEKGLVALSKEMERLAAKELPDACVEELTAAAATFEEMRTKIAGLLAGIDSDQRADQTRAMKTYNRELLAVGNGFAPTFRSLTKVCYSPEDLASINASPSPSD